MTYGKYTFSKKERVKSKKKISRIFNDGIFFYSDFISIIFIESENKFQKEHKIVVSVPKKLFKSAVKRNRLKRLIKEAYRLNKNILYDFSKSSNVFFDMVFIYRNNKIAGYKETEKQIIYLLKKVISKR